MLSLRKKAAAHTATSVTTWATTFFQGQQVLPFSLLAPTSQRADTRRRHSISSPSLRAVHRWVMVVVCWLMCVVSVCSGVKSECKRMCVLLCGGNVSSVEGLEKCLGQGQF